MSRRKDKRADDFAFNGDGTSVSNTGNSSDIGDGNSSSKGDGKGNNPAVKSGAGAESGHNSKGITARIVRLESASTMMSDTPEDREHLLTPSADDPVAVVSAQPMVEVIAPAVLAEGYQFPATVGNKTFMVTVPKGGCQERQRFLVPLPHEEDCIRPRVQVPVGHWKDGLWDLFQHGFCHVTVWNSCCCVPIAVGQIITRLQLTWKGKPTNSIHEATGAFRKLFYITCFYWCLRATMLFIISRLDPNAKFDGSYSDSTRSEDYPNSYFFCCALDDLFYYSFYLFTANLLRNVRAHVRSKYAIPEADYCPKNCEDCCCSLVCPCFTVGQILRHTTEYDVYDGKCCTSTGLPAHVPAIV